jgi:zeaxanthin glucosyltransferase
MPLIAFLMDIEEGHLLPSFGLAQSLQMAGHEITYISLLDNEDFIRRHGFGFYPIFEDIYPKGFKQTNKQIVRKEGYKDATSKGYHIESITNDHFGAFLKVLKPDLFITSFFLSIEILVLYYRFRIKPVILTPFLREPDSNIASACIQQILELPSHKSVKLVELMNKLDVNFSSLRDLIAPLNGFHEIILCPEELELEKRKLKNVSYIDASLSRERKAEDPARLTELSGGKRIIYASLGSQTITYGEIGHIFFATILEVMLCKEMQDFHLILSVGQENDTRQWDHVPSNVTVVNWISQLTVLKVASVAVIHGGLGTVKECIYYGVPMVVLPIARDQPSNARRVEGHQLGLIHPADKITTSTLLSVILQVIGSKAIKEGVRKMQKLFRDKEDSGHGITVIENFLKMHGMTGIRRG